MSEHSPTRDEARIHELSRDLTAVRAVCAGIAIMMQERAALPDPGGSNYSLLQGSVLVYTQGLEKVQEAATRLCEEYPDYEEFDPLRELLGLPLYSERTFL